MKIPLLSMKTFNRRIWIYSQHQRLLWITREELDLSAMLRTAQRLDPISFIIIYPNPRIGRRCQLEVLEFDSIETWLLSPDRTVLCTAMKSTSPNPLFPMEEIYRFVHFILSFIDIHRFIFPSVYRY